MFCIHCGKQIEDGKIMCDACAAAQNAPANPVAEPVVQQPVQPVYQQPAEPVVQQPAQPVYQHPAEPVYQQPVYQQPVQPAAPAFTVSDPAQAPKKAKKPKSPKKFPVGAVIAITAVVAIAASVAIFWESLTGLFVRNFGSPEDYMSHVEEKEAEKSIGTITDAYGSLLGALGNFAGVDVSDKVENKVESNGDYATKTQFQMEISEDILDMLELFMEEADMEMDLGWLSDITMSLLLDFGDDMTRADVGFGLSKDTVATISMLVNLAEGDLYMGIPELSDTYLHMFLEDYVDTSEMPDMEEVQEMLDEMVALLPSETALNDALNRWYTIVLDNVGEVEKSSETLEAGDFEQKLTVLECTVTQEDLYNILIAILEDVQDDKELMKSVYGIAEYAYLYDEDEVDETIDYALEELEYMLDEADEDNCINLTTYTDSSDQIVGRVIEVETAEGENIEISYLTVWEKDEFAFEADIAGVVEITGSGSSKKDVVDGEYEIEVEGENILTLEISGYDQKAAEEGYLNGTFTLTPSEEIMEMMMSEVGAELGQFSELLDIAKASFQVDISSNESASSISMRLMVGKSTMFGVTMSSEQVESSGAKVPKDYIEMDDQEALMEWVLDMDFEKLMENLDDAGLPDEIMDMLEMVVDQMDYYGY